MSRPKPPKHCLDENTNHKNRFELIDPNKKESLRIIIFSPFDPSHIGGVERVVSHLSKIFSNLGNEVIVVCCNTNNQSSLQSIENVQYVRLDCLAIRSSEYPIFLPTISNMKLLVNLFSKRIDIINTHTRFFSTSILGVLLSRLKSVPCIHTEHGSTHFLDGDNKASRASQLFDHTIGKFVIKGADCIISVSNASMDFCHHIYGPANVQVVYNGIELPGQSEDIDSDKLYSFIFIGRLVKSKGVGCLIKALSILDKELDIGKTIIIGDGSELENLMDLVVTLGLDHKVEFRGKIDHEEAMKLLTKSKCLINPSFSEGLPTTVLESMANGIPVIVSNVSAHNELVKDHFTGLIFELGNPDSLAKCMLEILNNDEICRTISINARNYSMNFEWTSCAQKYLTIFYDEIKIT